MSHAVPSRHPTTMFQAMVPGVAQTVAIGATSIQSNKWQTGVTIIRVFATVDCYLAFGTDPTANDSSHFCPGGIIQYFGVFNYDELAVIRKSSDGTLYIMEGA